MVIRIILFVAILGLVGIFVPESPAALGDRSPKSPSVSEFSRGLQGLAESTDRLQRENDRQERLNAGIKERVGFLEKNVGQLTKENQQLEKEILELGEKTKGKDEQIKQIQDSAQKSLDALKKTDQEIALSQIAFAERQKQQKYLLEILTLAREKGSFHIEMKSVLENQETLRQKASSGLKRVEDLEREWKELSFWYGDSTVSLPQLTDVKNKIQEQIKGYQRNNVSAQWTRNHTEMKRMEKEIKEIVFQHDLYMDMYKALESKYIEGDLSKEVQQEEQKLQINLTHLKRKNKALQKQAGELRYEMVNLDKKKTELEADQ